MATMSTTYFMRPATDIGQYFHRVRPLDLSGYERMPISVFYKPRLHYPHRPSADGQRGESADSRPTISRQSSDILPDFGEKKMSADGKNPTQLYFFSSAGSFEVLVSGLTTRPTIGRSSVDNRPTSNEK